MSASNFIRWIAIAVSLSVALYFGWSLAHVLPRSLDSTFLAVVLAVFGCFVVGVPLVTAVLLMRKSYHALASLYAGLGAVGVFFTTSHLVRHLHIDDYLVQWVGRMPSLSMVALPISLLILILPFWTASKFMTFSFGVLNRLTRHRSDERTPQP
ncbi:hypothetical protein [Prosthecobacter vanneervenii]|uniref:Uncharacterized protein n=1 Tax=Prosthecobacter vanneervenii TaxID=48466 RepID=A0A7W7YF33_9BACT|nr:hypothetical protein [Prosthecobacter vanneervenii]MBB5034949.1 hypothetical protein [Prosthecobacter vanneervenii]